MEPVDGFTVERAGDKIFLTFSNRYGQGEVYTLTIEDARKILEALEQYIGP